ncbi:hypothetical protein ACFY71_39615 [Streptomyces cinerochromogenes]|uniref:hypothetical protein n=1 Tax=Streptomyces cinerochromogenes TaxID=66422 RepID=UPI0036BD610D
MAEAPLVRRLVERAEAALANGQPEDMERIIAESNAGVERVEKIRQEAETEHLAAVAERFVDLFKLHHRQFEYRIAQLLNFDGFAVERWNGGPETLLPMSSYASPPLTAAVPSCSTSTPAIRARRSAQA